MDIGYRVPDTAQNNSRVLGAVLDCDSISFQDADFVNNPIDPVTTSVSLSGSCTTPKCSLDPGTFSNLTMLAALDVSHCRFSKVFALGGRIETLDSLDVSFNSDFASSPKVFWTWA